MSNKRFKPSGKNINCLENWICPECGNEDEFLVDTVMTVSLTDEGTDPYADSTKMSRGTEYDDNSTCRCPKCSFGGKVSDFYYRAKLTREEMIQKLIADEFESLDDTDTANILADGCIGYNNMEPEQIKELYKLHIDPDYNLGIKEES